MTPSEKAALKGIAALNDDEVICVATLLGATGITVANNGHWFAVYGVDQGDHRPNRWSDSRMEAYRAFIEYSLEGRR